MSQALSYLRPKQAAEYLGISQSTFFRLVSSGKIQTKKISPRITICSVIELENFVNSAE